MKTIYVVGSSNTDMVVKCGHIPAPGETVVGGMFFQIHGGKGANQAVAAARLGGRVVFLCRVGDDSNGRLSLDAYQQEGIDISHANIEPGGKSGVALIIVGASGENSIAVASGVNANMIPGDVDVLRTLLKPGDVVLLQLEIPLQTVQRAAEIGRESGAIVILDPAPVPSNNLPDSLLQQIDYFLPNEHEAVALAGEKLSLVETAGILRQRGCGSVIITAGPAGCVWADSDELKVIPAFSVNAVDTTAAGDAFAGGLSVALAEEIPIGQAILFAQKAAAISVTRMGAQSSLPLRNEIDTCSF